MSKVDEGAKAQGMMGYSLQVSKIDEGAKAQGMMRLTHGRCPKLIRVPKYRE